MFPQKKDLCWEERSFPWGDRVRKALPFYIFLVNPLALQSLRWLACFN